MSAGPGYSAAELARLIALAKLGWSAGRIAKAMTAEFGTARTASAIVGKAHRENIQIGGASTAPNKHQALSVAARNASKARGARKGGQPSWFAAQSAAVRAHAPRAAVDLSAHPHALAFLDAKYGQCRYILNDPRAGAICCGAPADGAYCDTHRALCSAGKKRAA